MGPLCTAVYGAPELDVRTRSIPLPSLACAMKYKEQGIAYGSRDTVERRAAQSRFLRLSGIRFHVSQHLSCLGALERDSPAVPGV